MGVADTEVSVLVDAGLWASIEGEAAMVGPVVWGVDLGTSAAQSAVAAFWPETGALACLAAFPSEPSLDERGRRDGVAGLYRECHRRGELLTLGATAWTWTRCCGPRWRGSAARSRSRQTDGERTSCGMRWRRLGFHRARSSAEEWGSATAARTFACSGGRARLAA